MPENQRLLPLCLCSWGGDSVDRHRERLAEAARAGLDFDVYWVDAGWYGSHGGVNVETDYSFVGNFGEWRSNPAIFPDGLGGFADEVHAAGMKFLLWFEVENADRRSPVAQAHPEWFLPLSPDGGTLQIDLSRPDAEAWMLETLSTAIRDYRVDFLRQDFNVSPLAAWRARDRVGRTGETEIRCVEALYRIYDSLHERFPQLMFDNCASGGNRLDFEMMKRSVPLWASDMQCDDFFDCEDAQNLAAGLHCWLPCFGLGVGRRPLDTYNFRSAAAAGRSVPLNETGLTPEEAGWLRERFAEYRRLAPLFSADYYLLSKRLPEADQWLAMQFDDPESGCGAVLAFRRAACDYTGMTVRLKGVDPAAEYTWTDADTGATGKASGRELRAEGMALTDLDRRESLLRFYRREK